jgi:redox-sensitive bicupin YhaK (pirin superfamily)
MEDDHVITLRKSEERGHFDHGWLDTHHTFSFADYFDPQHMGFRTLRVINEDRVKPGEGFGTHPHRDMEIITYVMSGALEHKDSMGNGSIITPGEVQRMSAGTGVTHSEFNPSKKEPVHFLQIWILPDKTGLRPSYEQKTIPEEAKRGRLKLIASRDGRQGSVAIHQDASVYACFLSSGEDVAHKFGPSRHGWLQVVEGQVSLAGQVLHAGDGAALSGENQAKISAREDAEFLLFDLN